MRILRDDGVPSLARAAVRWASRRIKGVLINPILFKLYTIGVLDVDNIYGSKYYEKMKREQAITDAEDFARVVRNKYGPESVIDLGCGVGRFLTAFNTDEISIQGVDASEYAVEHALVPDDCVTLFNLENLYTPDSRVDMVLCIEVVEHLPESASDTIAQSIANSGRIAIISTATPGQGGTHHVNEQTYEYWIEKLTAAGMEYQPAETEALKDAINPTELGWLKENILVFHQSKAASVE
jgi:2-polyprenyl-3-methyl-5-hydroxy-6-metoxy-1,4-benzoquinol methylase